ncbi:MAG: hypothetical protein IJ618_07295 [Prevotella sp.]|nr:hypothetical protein [Prevotella sp.]
MGKELTFAAVSRSLNRLEGFVDDFLLTVQSYNEKRNIEIQNAIVDGHKETMVIYPIDIKESIIRYVKEVERNVNGDESIEYIGIRDCVDFILNSQSMLLAKRAFSIESKVREIESILLSYCSGSMIKPVSDLTWQTEHILWEIGELHIEPFILENNQDAVIPKTGEKLLTKDEIIKSLEKIKPYKPLKDDEPINYKEYYKRLTEGGVIDNKWTLDLFLYCVERADISKLLVKAEKKKDGKKQYARLFMNDVASCFSDSAQYRKKAAESFGLGENVHVGAVGGNAKTEYQNMMKGLFAKNHQKKRP